MTCLKSYSPEIQSRAWKTDRGSAFQDPCSRPPILVALNRSRQTKWKRKVHFYPTQVTTYPLCGTKLRNVLVSDHIVISLML